MDKANGDAPFIPLYGTAVPGAGLGRLAGLPAAGLRLHRGQAAPEPGVYAAEILLGGRCLCGLAHIAPGGGAPSIELLFFHGGEAPCGEAVELRLRQRLRRCQPFDNLPLLSAQLRLDCLSAQSFWGISPGSPRLSMESAGRRAVVGMQAIPLSEKEFGVLYLLYTHPDVPITKEQIYEAVWRAPSNHCLHAVENTVFQIRRRLRPHAGGHDFIRTVAGLGYQFNPG